MKASSSRESRRRIFLWIALGCLALAIGYTSWVVLRARAKPVPLPGQEAPEQLAEIQSRPHLLYLHQEGPDYGQVNLAGLDPSSPREARTALRCDRAHYAAGKGICLIYDTSAAAQDPLSPIPVVVTLFGSDFQPQHQFTVDGTTHRLPEPFFVIATQNPVDLSGTYPLPDSQLDRFLLRLSLGYPDESAERALLSGEDRRGLIARATPRLGGDDVMRLRQAVTAVHASEALVHYVQALLARSRHAPGVRVGLSPRAGIALLRAARAHALLQGRTSATPADVQVLFGAVAAHRLVPDIESGSDGAALATAILRDVPVD